MIPFEKKKNTTAFVVTALVCSGIFLLCTIISWRNPVVLPLPTEEGIEVNFGNSETGFGTEPVKSTETIAPSTETATSVEQTDPPAIETLGDEPIASKPTVIKRTSISPTPKPILPPTPKATLGKINTAAGAAKSLDDSYSKASSEGIAGGKGDQGNINGNLQSKNYSGGGNGMGVSIRSGLDGRRIQRFPKFEEEFSENAKVAVDIEVDRNGKVTKASINPRGTTTANGGIKKIAIEKAYQLKLSDGDEDAEVGTIIFEFKLRG